MKANAPEKLYINFHFIETHPESHQPLVTKQGINKYDIEYTRTDAFIEKACSWLENNLQGIVGGSIYMEDFKNYMKGTEG